MWYGGQRSTITTMPDDSYATIRKLSDDDLHALMEGQKPHTARYIAASREVQWRQDRGHLFATWFSIVISVLALLVSLASCLQK